MDLRDASEAQRVLQEARLSRLPEPAVGESRPQCLAGADLARLAARLVDLLAPGPQVAAKALHRHRARKGGRVEQGALFADRQNALGKHQAVGIEQRHRLLGGEALERRGAMAAGLGAGTADQRHRHLAHRHDVRGADGHAEPCSREIIHPQPRHEALDEFETDSGPSAGKERKLDGQRRAHHLRRRITARRERRMRGDHEVVVAGDRLGIDGEILLAADASRDAVGGNLLIHKPVDDGARLADRLAPIRRKGDDRPALGNGADIVDRQRLRAHGYGHRRHRRLPSLPAELSQLAGRT